MSELDDRDVQLAAVYARVPDRKSSMPPQAEVIVNLTAPFPSWRWLKLQLLGVNWATLALLIAVLGVSANIKDQLDSLRAQSIAAHQSFVDMRVLLEQAKPVADSLSLMNTELHEYNATLQLAISLGLTNLTGDLAKQRAATKHLGLTLDTGTISRSEYIPTTGYQFSNIQLVLAPPGRWLLLGSINVNNAACSSEPVLAGCTDAVCSVVTTDPNGPMGHYDQCTSVTRNPTG
jgi:hypothetical protein